MATTSPQRPSTAARFLRLSPTRLALVALAWVVAVVAHNVTYGLLYERFPPGWDEPFFFVLAIIVIPAYLVAAAGYTLAAAVLRRRHG